MRCPRRMESLMFADKPGEDLYRSDDDSCTHCGSLNPDTFMQRVERGDVRLCPTDKNYKVYIHNDGGEQFKQTYRDCYTQGAKDCKHDTCTHWVTRDMSQAKFYFQHLSDAQKDRFIELLNANSVKMEYPGYFYVLPFFCTRAMKAEA